MAIWEMVKYYSNCWIIIVWSLVVFVYAEVTLRLRDDAVVYGQPFALVCFTTVIASSQYAAFYRSLDPSSNGILVAYITSNGSGFCHPSPSNFPNYTYSCNNDGKEITLTVPGDNLNEHDTSWRCTNRGGTVLANNNKVSVFVNVPISFVQLYQAGSITLSEFESRALTCTTSFCRPEAVISWWKNDVHITSMANSSTYDQNTSTGTLVYTGNRLDNGHSIVCKAWNGYGSQQTSQKTILDIRYAPAGPPTIGSYSNGSVFSVIENMSQSLACIVTGGNPLPYLSWKCFGLAVSSITVNQTVTSTISLTVNRFWDHRQCQCVSTQEIQGNRTAFVVIHVLFPPTVSVFSLAVKVIEGHPLDLLCSAEGNPPPQLTWSPLGEDTVNKSRLYYHSISRINHGNHTCTAINTMVPTMGSPVTQSDSKRLFIDVLFHPTVIPVTLLSVIEGNSLEQKCRADGNPPPKLTWSPRGDDTVNQSRLYYRNIARSNHGNHTCTATNTMEPTTGEPMTGSDSKIIFIDVQYRASIYAFTAKGNNNMLMENDSLELHCLVDSNPYSDIILYHEDMSQLMKEDHALKLNYTKTAGCLDAGKYTCHAKNSVMHGKSVSSDLQMMVACSPRIDHRKNVSTVYYTRLNSNITLEVYVIAYPEPSNITWYHKESETDTWQKIKYQPPSSGGLFSSIRINLISMRDLGYYMVTMDNYLGNFSNIYSIIPKNRDQAEAFPVGAVAGGISGSVVTVVVVILVIIFLIRGGLRNKDEGDDFITELQADGKSIRNHVYANSGTSFIPTGGEYEALQANRNEGSFYQELSDIKSCADANCSLRRNVTVTTEKHSTCVNTKETTIASQDQENLPKGENKLYENTRVQA